MTHRFANAMGRLCKPCARVTPAFPEAVLLDTDQLFARLLQEQAFQRTMTTPELHDELGAQVQRTRPSLGGRSGP